MITREQRSENRPQPPQTNFHLLAKPSGAACNLSCEYCYFLSKERLYQGDSHLMNDVVLETYVRQLMEASPGPDVYLSWQGGEPMLRGLEFFRRALRLAEKHRKPHQRVVHTIQTNGTLVDEQWARFFKENAFLVGISIDGPAGLHNAYRIDKQGAGSFEEVLRGWKILQGHDVTVNILCTINAQNAQYPLEIYRYFRDGLGARYIQFIPVVERGTPETIAAANLGWGSTRGLDRPLYKQEGTMVTRRSVKAKQFGSFLVAIFDEWVKRDVGRVFVTTFDVALGSWLGEHNLCIVAPTCGNSLVLEHTGDVYACDHYVEPDHRVGNISDVHLKTLVTSEKQRRFGQHKWDSLPDYCRKCPVLFACFGECPRNRFIRTPDGEEGLNYLCEGYRDFFLHINEPMKRMAALIRSGRYADEIMQTEPAQMMSS